MRGLLLALTDLLAVSLRALGFRRAAMRVDAWSWAVFVDSWIQRRAGP